MALDMRSVEVQEALGSVEWDFASSSVASDVHSIHPYPAKFISQIPRHLIELFRPEEGTTVFDPFCGSGTTLLEATRAGFDAIGVDVNPLATLIATVKTTPLSEDLHVSARRAIKAAHTLSERGNVVIPDIPNLDHWFSPDVQVALASIVPCIEREEDESVRNALKVALSSIIVQVSNQESDTRYAAIQKNVNSSDVFAKFDRAAMIIGTALSSSQSKFFEPQLGTALVLTQDILTVTRDRFSAPVGLVITSPPYPNAYEYWLYHKYRMFWLGMDPISVRAREIGARPHYFRTRHQDEHDFEEQMRATFSLLAQIMRPGAKACFLVGRSIIHGRTIDNVALLERAANPVFMLSGDVVRSIPRNRKSFNLAHARINTEHLLVFTRQ